MSWFLIAKYLPPTVLGPVAGVLFAGLFLGHFDFRMSAGAQAVGFALFIFSVGYQAGPRFFDVLRTDGLKYFLLALVVAATGFFVALVASQLLSLAPGTSAGLLSGGLTSSPTLAAAQEAIRSGQVEPPEGLTADAMIGNVATAYAITYIFGLAGLIAIIKLLPQVLGIGGFRDGDIGGERADTLHQYVHVVPPVGMAVIVDPHPGHLVAVLVTREQAHDHFRVFPLLAGGGAVLAVAGDIEDGPDLVLQRQRLADQFLAAGEMLTGRDDGKGFLAAEEGVPGVHGFCH